MANSNCTDYSQLSDEELLADYSAAGGSERLSVIISRYKSLVLSMARRYSSSADYGELVSDGLDALVNAVNKYSADKGSFAAFVKVCVGNRMINTVDAAIRRESRLTDDSELINLADNRPSPEELTILKEELTTLNTEMNRILTELERRCLDGVVLGYSYDEIAKKLGIENKAVDNAVARARAKLRAMFPDF
ncbi:MAG: sigma-70 family RNA polymerase sigma factor [Oscillospiraceae bacterium]